MRIDVGKIRSFFPLFHGDETFHSVYLDNAATTLKPIRVIEKMNELYCEYPVNVHRGAYKLAERASGAFEEARREVAKFIHAKSTKEIIFTRGTTEAINLVARSFGENSICSDDEIIVSSMEHHANIVPWMMLCQRTGARLRVIPMNEQGVLDLEAFASLLGPKTKLVGIVHISNSLGTINEIERIVKEAQRAGARVLIDAAQSISHFPMDVQKLGADFVAFSGHKMYGPFGVGILYGKEELLREMPPFLGGGGMIKHVSFEKIVFADLPNKFEPGTPSIGAVVGLGEAIRFMNDIGFEVIQERERELTMYAKEALSSVQGLRIYGDSPHRSAVFSFNLQGVHAHDLNTFLDQKGVAIRSGHHCNQPVMDFFRVPAMNRMSLAFYNELREIDYVVEVLHQAKRFFL